MHIHYMIRQNQYSVLVYAIVWFDVDFVSVRPRLTKPPQEQFSTGNK